MTKRWVGDQMGGHYEECDVTRNPGRVGVAEMINAEGQALYEEFCAAIEESK